MTITVNATIKGLLSLMMVVFCSAMFKVAYAWDHEVSLGYNRSKELNYDYYNYGFFLNAKLYKFKKLDKTLIFTIDGSVADWHATTETNSSLNTWGLAGAFRAYFISPENRKFNPYLSAAFGPVYLSKTHFGERNLGSHFSFQTVLGFGTEFFPSNSGHGFNASLQLIHYCNAGLSTINQGVNMVYVFSLGYLF